MRAPLIITLSVAFACGSLPVMADVDAYVLNLSRGKFPSDVVTANLNGTEPDVKAYARGWTDQGWTVNRLDDRGYVALSPTYSPGAACENLLELPPILVESGMELSWQAKSVYRHFPESYRVEARSADGTDVIELAIIGEENFAWTPRSADLSRLAGKEVSLRFICTSTEGYMFALTDVRAGDPLTAGPDDGTSTVGPETGFTRKLLVDHGTGMWCTNCPPAEAEIGRLADIYGDRLIMLNTHVNDVLGNPDYWTDLNWFSVPRMMLNRIPATEGQGTVMFKDYVDLPTNFSISVDGGPDAGKSLMKLAAEVKVAEPIDNTSGRYRVGFVLTADYHDPANPDFAQHNGSSQPSAGAFYYLPKLIVPPLMYYDDVTLTSETAFSGIEGSLPATLEPGNPYRVEWEMAFPELMEDPAKARIVAMVLDTESGEVLNADARLADGKPDSGVDISMPDAQPSTAILLTGNGIDIRLPDGTPYTVAIYAADGSLLDSLSGKGHTLWTPRRYNGIRIIVLTSPLGTQTIKSTIK